MEKDSRPYTRNQLESAALSIESTTPREGRDIDEYVRDLGIRVEDIKGKVLDLGSSNGLAFARSAKEKGIDAQIVSFSPAFKDVSTRKNARMGQDAAGRLMVAGMGEELPFSDNSFNTVLILHVAQYLNDEERLRRFLFEAVRVLQPGGSAYIGPLSGQVPFTTTTDAYRKVMSVEGISRILDGKALTVGQDGASLYKSRHDVAHIIKNSGL